MEKHKDTPNSEADVIKRIISRIIYLCKNLDTVNHVLGMKNAKDVMYDGIGIADIELSPLSFTVETTTSKTYIFYNSATKKARYNIIDKSDLEKIDSATTDIKDMVESELYLHMVKGQAKHVAPKNEMIQLIK